MSKIDITMYSDSELSDIAVNHEYFYNSLEKGRLTVEMMENYFIFTDNQKQDFIETIKDYEYDKYSDGDYQNKVKKLVNNNVYYCASYLIGHLAKDCSFIDEYLHLLERAPDTDDYKEAFRYQIKSEGLKYCDDDFDHSTLGEWRRLFDSKDLQHPEPGEIFEHWIISDRLADKLAVKGEVIEKDLHGLTIWGRVCTGQAILLDRVICDIYDDIQKEIESWEKES